MVDVTVIIPTFNRIWSLPGAIESCRLNSCSTEIIVVDDGSTDGTWEWLQSQSVVAIKQQNWGKGNAVNRAVAVAQGEFIRFLDSDDMLPASANDAQFHAGRTTGADIVVAGYIARFENTNTERVRPWVHCDDFISQQLGECDSSHYSAYLFRATFLADLRHRPEFAFRDDRMFVIEAALRHPKITVVESPCLIHRHHSRNRIQFGTGMISIVTYWQEMEMFRKAEALLNASGGLNARRRTALARSLWPLAHRIGSTHSNEARSIVRWIRTLDPAAKYPGSGILSRFYNKIGFGATQALVKCAKLVRNLSRKLVGRSGPYFPNV